MTTRLMTASEDNSPMAQHIALSDEEKPPPQSAESQFNVDQNGWALIESYIWDIGNDEEIERLIDKALRILLIHPEFEKFIWKNKETLQKLYVDETFPDVVSQIHRIIMEITQEMVVLQIENNSAFSSLTKSININNLKGIFNKHVAGKSDPNEVELASDITEKKENEIGSMTNEHPFYDDENNEDLAQKYAFWNITRYLEIEINAMPQFDVKKSNKSTQDKQKVIWKGFIVPPTHGTVAVNHHPDDDTAAIRTANTEFIPIDVEKRKTVFVKTEEVDDKHCNGCYVRMTEINWHKDDKPYCSQCIKFRVYQECVRKFVLEYDNEEIRDDLWPWYENSKNQYDLQDYKMILDMYTDQVLVIGTILESNLKYYVPRSQTLDAAKYGTKSNLKNDDNDDRKRNLLIKARTQFQPYRNIRYLRKFAAMFLLGDREIWKDLLKLKKYLKKSRYQFGLEKEKGDEPDNGDNDKSAIDDEGDFKITSDDRTHLQELLNDTEIDGLLYGKHGIDRINEIQQRILNRPSSNNNKLYDVLDDDISENMKACKPGIDRFLKIWSRLPIWWSPLHDRILLELALMHKLDVTKYYDELDDEEYYQEELEDHYYRAFEFWCTKEVNVQHRLRFLLYVIDQREYPDSMIFMNDIMKNSHTNSFKRYKKKKKNENEEEKGDHYDGFSKKRESKLLLKSGYDENYDEKPVRDIEREFRDIVQLLEPEALGVRIWRFIMNQMAAKQRKSLWKALTILAEELPSNMILSLLEEDRDLLRRGKPRYVNAVCQAVIKGSNYPVATALHLARYMDENAQSDLARTEIWTDFCDQYEDIAIYLINEVESDHLLSLLLEIPTDIQQKTIIEMAVLYRRVRFVNSARVQGVMTHLWGESEFLNPYKPVRTTYLNGYEFWKLLWKSPVRFYFCPLGLYASTALLYVGYLLLVSYVTWKWVYPYSDYKFFSLETLMWISNAGYILYEVLELESKRAQYFAMDSLINVFDTIISINWILLFCLRVFAGFLASDGYVGDPGLDPTIDRSNPLVEGSALIRTDPTKRNEQYTILYMALWSVQIVILWIRIVGLLQRTEIMGPLLRMMLIVAKDIASFMILVIAVTMGFLFAIHFIVGGDIDRDVTCDILTMEADEAIKDCVEASQPINSVRGITIYLIQTLLGQQDWDVLDENPLYGFDRGRAQLITVVILAYVAPTFSPSITPSSSPSFPPTLAPSDSPTFRPTYIAYSNNIISNYILINNFGINGFIFPAAIGKCMNEYFGSNTYIKYECLDQDTVIHKIYDDIDCNINSMVSG